MIQQRTYRGRRLDAYNLIWKEPTLVWRCINWLLVTIAWSRFEVDEFKFALAESNFIITIIITISSEREREREREKTNWFQHTHYAQPLFCVFDTPSIFFTVSRLLWPIDSFFLSFSLSHQSSFIRFAVDDRWRIIFCPVHCFSFSSSTPVQATISLLFALFTAAVYDDDKRDEWMVHSFPLSLSLY